MKVAAQKVFLILFELTKIAQPSAQPSEMHALKSYITSVKVR